MHPPIKDHATFLEHEGPELNAAASPNNPDMAKQEFKDEADINYMLSRFGITQPRGTPAYGEWDDAIDLQNAIAAVEISNDAYRQLPIELRRKFASMNDLIRAVDNGTLIIRDKEPDLPLPDTTTPIPPVPPTPPAPRA